MYQYYRPQYLEPALHTFDLYFKNLKIVLRKRLMIGQRWLVNWEKQPKADLTKTKVTWAINKNPGLVVWCIEGIILLSYIGIITNHYKDVKIPIKPSDIGTC